MARDVRQSFPTTPVKASKRRGSDTSSSLSNLSDDDGYSGVDAISDEDDEEEDVDAAEEEHIISHVYQSSPRPVMEAEEEEEEEEADDDEDEADDENEDEEEDDEDDGGNDSASWEGFMDDDGVAPAHQDNTSSHVPDPGTTSPRRVRFDVPDSDGESTDTDDDLDVGFFPDIFVDQNALDPSFRREIEHDEDEGNSSESISFWDFHEMPEDFDDADYMINEPDSEMDPAVIAAFEEDDSTPVATPLTSQEISTTVSTPMPSPEVDDLSLDGYESDGETTEDEDPPEPIRRKAKVEEEASDSDAITLIKPRRGKPRVGRFNLDSTGTKPVAVVNPKTGKLMIFTPQRLRRLDLSPEQFNFPFFEPVTQSSPILSNSGNLMMGAMFSSNTFGDYVNTQAVGPVEAFFSMTSGDNGIEESSEEDVGEVEEAEQGLAIDDFIHFDEDSSSDEDNDGGAVADDDDDVFVTPARPSTASSDVTHLLSQLENNSNIVGTFRRDQANSQLIRNGKATRESLAFGGSFYQGTLRGIKDGRIHSTNVPISPLRKQKKMTELASSPLSGMAQKRKASSEQQWSHKRHRSISDVNSLHL
ncbi:uncharacterized protein BCR38DRAFT_346705 [Pseudomassariella vexata]|uniref:Uncharacterized protein n=1 Tax=Pseudomassariella vexata TaxID=1141098 RepID=A0A1Y2DS04_9PEZI|nr:uncharacterized protein BCR38DRAFT_346705 [Pseudomassariella vexata]ORY62050.1 hypothetical protein BCR38DRAFT_346705 [Pseudomassariella vexata]